MALNILKFVVRKGTEAKNLGENMIELLKLDLTIKDTQEDPFMAEAYINKKGLIYM